MLFRSRTFFTLAELNAAVADCVSTLNERKSRHLGASRRELFEKIEQSTLKSLPVEPYEFAAWKEVSVGLDYHVDIEKHYYSVPHTEPPRVCRRLVGLSLQAAILAGSSVSDQ